MTYQELFDAYVADMRKAVAAAQRWWVALLAEESARQGDAERAREAIRLRWPFGVASHPIIIAAYRHWALECQRLNDETEAAGEDDDGDLAPDDESAWGVEDEADDTGPDLASLEGPIEPRDLLIDMLAGRADDVAQIMVDFVFDPVGLDKDDRWV